MKEEQVVLYLMRRAEDHIAAARMHQDDGIQNSILRICEDVALQGSAGDKKGCNATKHRYAAMTLKAVAADIERLYKYPECLNCGTMQGVVKASGAARREDGTRIICPKCGREGGGES